MAGENNLGQLAERSPSNSLNAAYGLYPFHVNGLKLFIEIVHMTLQIQTRWGEETFSFPLNQSPDDPRLLVIDELMRDRLNRLFPPSESKPVTKDQFQFVQNLVLGQKNVGGGCYVYAPVAHRLFQELFGVETRLMLLRDGNTLHGGCRGMIQPSTTAIQRMDPRVRGISLQDSFYHFRFHCVLRTGSSEAPIDALDLGARSPEPWDSWRENAWGQVLRDGDTEKKISMPQTIQALSSPDELFECIMGDTIRTPNLKALMIDWLERCSSGIDL